MAIIPQVITSDRATGAQVIDGSLKIDSSASSHLRRTPGSAGNRKTFTFSGWVKKYEDTHSTDQSIIVARTDGPTQDDHVFGCRIEDDGRISVYDMGNFYVRSGVGRVRDTTGWYHIFFSVNTTVASNNVKLYLNGDLVGQGTYAQNADTRFNSTDTHRIGRREEGSDLFQLNAGLSNYYVIDGQALEPTDFGFTDPLTNTWKPKKYEGDFGTNGFWLPFDGSAPIGQDQSGKGNDWTPVNFGGSMELDNPNVSGARPILNTTQGGAQAAVGVFGSKENQNITVTVASKTGGGNAYFFDSVERDSLATIRGSTITFDTTDSTNNSHPFKLSSTNADSSGGTEYTDGVAYYINGSTVSGSDYVSNYSTNGGGTGFRGIKWTVPHNVSTTYYYCTVHNGMGEGGRLTSTTDETKADPYAWKNVLALPLVSDKEDVSNQINSGSTAKTISSNGSPAASGEQSNFYGKSFQFIETDSDRLDCTIAALGTRDFTLEFWFYTSSTTGYQTLAEYGDHTSNGFYLSVRDGTAIMARSSVNADIANAGGGTPGSLPSGSLINTPTGKYHHIALTRESNTAKLFQNGKYIGSGTWSTNYTPTNLRLAHSIYSAGSAEYLTGFMQDVRLYDGVVKYTGTTVNEQSFVVPSRSPDILPDTPSGVSGSSKLTKITDGAVSFNGSDQYLSVADNADFTVGSNPFTIEFYAYKTESGEDFFCGSANSGGADTSMSYAVQTGGGSPSNSLRAHVGDGSSLTTVNSGVDFPTNRWVHVAFVRDGNTLRLFQDGVQMSTTSFSGTVKDSADPFMIGRGFGANSTKNFPGIISNFRFIKGTALYTKNFTPPSAPLTNVTNTKLLCCQSPTSAIEAAVSPSTPTNGGTSLATNFNPFNTDINTVRGQETGYATFSPLLNRGNNTLSDGNTFVTGGSNWNTTHCTGVIESGKWFVELTHKGRQSASDNDIQFGLFGIEFSENGLPLGTTKDLAAQSTGYVIVDAQAQWYNNGSSTSYGKTWSTPGDVVGLRYNADTGKLGFIINGVDQGDISSTLSTSQKWIVGVSLRGGGAKAELNFGQKPFKFPPPDGFQPLNNANLRPVKVISRPDQYVGISTWTGTGTLGTKSISHNFKFAPDFIWAKERNGGSSHSLFDSVRGYGSNNVLKSNSDNGEGGSVGGYVDSVSTSSITWAQGASTGEFYDLNNKNYVAWCWRAGGSKGTFNKDDVSYASAAAAGLSGQSSNITINGCSIGTEQGLSIVKVTPSDNSAFIVPHGLSQTPDFVMIKNLGANQNWDIYFNGITSSTQVFELNTNLARTTTGVTVWNSVDSTKVSARGASFATSSNPRVVYFWHSVPGLQKFGTFEGTTQTDGPYIELGFKPALVFLKTIDTAANWMIYDNERNKFNPNNFVLSANVADGGQTYDAYSSAYPIDFTSNGFKVRTTATNSNADSTLIYMAWAEAPSIDLFGGRPDAR